MRLLSFVVLSMAVFAMSCDTPHTSKTDDEYEKVYSVWRSSVERKLREGSSSAQGDSRLLHYLAKHADGHVEFLREELQDDPFTVPILIDSEIDYKKYAIELGEVPGLWEYQRLWLIVLDRMIYDQTFTEWQELTRKPSKADKNAAEHLLQYLSLHAKDNAAFLKAQLSKDADVLAVLENSSLNAEPRDRLRDITTPRAKQQAWSDILEEEIKQAKSKKESELSARDEDKPSE
jgi:hypothetical protein